MNDEMTPVLLTPEEVDTRLRDLQDERMRVEGPTPDLDPIEVAAYIQDMENEARLLTQIRGLQQNMLLLEGGILSDDAQQGQPLRLELKMSEDGASDAKFARLDEGRTVTLRLAHLEMTLAIGDWCSLLARTDKGSGVPVVLALDPKFEIDDAVPPPLKAS